MPHIYSIIFIIGVLFIDLEFATLHCSQRINDAVQRCVQPVAQYARVLNQQDEKNSSNIAKNSFGQAITLPKIGRYVFRELCRLIRNFNDCVYKLRQQCPEHITISLIDASYGFLCNEGYETFMSSAECLIELDRQPTVKECHEITLKHIEAANDQLSTSASIRFDKMCQALNYFSSCVEGPISHGCGTKAWAMIFRVLRDTTNTLLPKCQFTGHSGLPSDFSASFSSTTTVVSVNKENHLSQYRDMLNDKAEIIWSNEDITASPGQLSQMENDGDQNFGDPLVAGPRRNTINSQGQRSKDEISRHVFIDKDTDISYYDSGSNSLIETASSSSFLASNSANHFCVFVIIFGHYLSFAWLFFKFY